MKLLVDQKGFTLVEVLIAVTVFAVGLLALGQTQLVSLHGNGFARSITEASSLAQSKLEELKILPFTDPDLADTDVLGTSGFGVGGLNATGANADHTETVTAITGRNYNLAWNVAKNADDTLLIRVIVNWTERAAQKQFSIDMLRGDIDL